MFKLPYVRNLNQRSETGTKFILKIKKTYQSIEYNLFYILQISKIKQLFYEAL